MVIQNDVHLNIEQIQTGHYLLSGDLTFATIDKNTVKTLTFETNGSSINLDLQKINKTDSAGLALILEWIKSARSYGVSIHLLNLPEQLLTIAKLSGLDVILTSGQNPGV